jgi:hypothetical protein
VGSRPTTTRPTHHWGRGDAALGRDPRRYRRC